jgi:hypothetical protein
MTLTHHHQLPVFFCTSNFQTPCISIFSIICYQLANKTRNLLFAIHLLIYIIYGDRTIIGLVSFVANLLNRPTDGATANTSEKVRP